MSSGKSDIPQDSGGVKLRRKMPPEKLERQEQANIVTVTGYLKERQFPVEAAMLEGGTIRFYRTKAGTLRAIIVGGTNSMFKRMDNWRIIQSAVLDLLPKNEFIEASVIDRGDGGEGDPREGEYWEFIVLSAENVTEKAPAAPPACTRPWDGIKWEQATVSIMGGMMEVELDKTLTRYGEDGWELVTAISIGVGCRLFFKRSKLPEA